MKIDDAGHILLTPKQLHALAVEKPAWLVNYCLMRGTPAAFATYEDYCAFLDDVSDRLGVHPNNLFLRGSCHIGYSIAPKSKVWTAMDLKPKPSDLDLVIVDVDYYNQIDTEVKAWEEDNQAECLQAGSKQHIARQKDPTVSALSRRKFALRHLPSSQRYDEENPR